MGGEGGRTKEEAFLMQEVNFRCWEWFWNRDLVVHFFLKFIYFWIWRIIAWQCCVGFRCTTGLSSKYASYPAASWISFNSFLSWLISSAVFKISFPLPVYLHGKSYPPQGTNSFKSTPWFHNRWCPCRKRQVGWERSCLPTVCKLGELQPGQVGGLVRPACQLQRSENNTLLCFLVKLANIFKTYLFVNGLT